MDKSVRVQLKRTKGWKMPGNTVKVDRSTRWGNPYCVGEKVSLAIVKRWGWVFSPSGKTVVCADAAEAVGRFRLCVGFDESIHPFIRKQLKGRSLGCWCKLCAAHKDGKPFGVECPDCAPCHSDPLGILANNPDSPGRGEP